MNASGSRRPAPLTGMRVIELSAYVASPLCGLVLSQLGADVVRVEPIGGGSDRTRMPIGPGGFSIYWAGLNAGKRALEVDLRAAEGRELVARLVAESGPDGGILVSNTTRLPELGEDALRRRRPDLIHVQLTGRRDGGTAVDYTVQAGTGLADLTGPAELGSPVNQVLPAWDLLCGMYLATGVLAAERHRRRTGQGRSVRVALEDVALATMGTLGYYTEPQVNGVVRPRDGNHVFGMLARDFACGDGLRVMLVVITARHWAQMCEVAGVHTAAQALEAALGADFADESQRYTHREVLMGLLAPWFAGRTRAEVLDALGRTSVLCTPYLGLADLAADGAARLAANPLFGLLDHPGIGRFQAAGSPLVVDGEPTCPRPAPGVGEHDDEILAELLRLTGAQVADLRSRGVLAPRSPIADAADSTTMTEGRP